MAFGQNSEGKEGLLFASELEENDYPSVMFVVPVINSLADTNGLWGYLEKGDFYFPILLGDKYIELKAKVNLPYFNFAIPGIDISYSFELEVNSVYPWPIILLNRAREKPFKYIGSHDSFLVKNDGFFSLLPIDLYEMDQLYYEHKGVFVGYTPNFPEKIVNDNQS